MLFIKYVLRIPLRMSEDKLLIGDDAIHGEDAYAFGDAPNAMVHPISTNEDSEFGVIEGQSPGNGEDEIK